jgi:plastocyanin
MARRVLLSFMGATVLAAIIVVVTMLSGADVPAVAHAGTAGTIHGTVQYGGTAPQPAVLQMAADPYCVTAHAGQTVLSEQLVVNDNNTVRWTFIHLSATGGALPAGTAETVELDQVGCMYQPHVLGMQAGATIRVVNSDQTLHNVNAQPRNNRSFNVAQPIPGMAIERTFENPEIMVPVRCDVHPWMQAYVGVVPHNFFAVSGDDGSFSLDGVPPGDYVLEAWHESLGTQTMNVTVRDGETATADFTFGSDQ